jgi:hypothetical protein
MSRTKDVASSIMTRPRQQSSIDLGVGNPSSCSCLSPGRIDRACRSSSTVRCVSARNTQVSVSMACFFLAVGCFSILLMERRKAPLRFFGIVASASLLARIVVCSNTCRICSAASKNLVKSHISLEPSKFKGNSIN